MRTAHAGHDARARRHLLLPVLHAVQDAVGLDLRGRAEPHRPHAVGATRGDLRGRHVLRDVRGRAAGAAGGARLRRRRLRPVRRRGDRRRRSPTQLGPEGTGQDACWVRSPCLGSVRARARGAAPARRRARPQPGPGGAPTTCWPRRGAPGAGAGRPGRRRASPTPGVSAPQTGPGGTLPGGGPLRLLRRVGVVDPESLDDYRAHGGYAALRRAVDLGPTRVITELEDSVAHRPRRRRVPHRREVEGRRRRPRAPALPGVQRRRVRARHVQGPRAHGGRPVRADRGDDDRRLRHRLRRRLPLHPRRVPAGHAPAAARDRRRPRPRLPRRGRAWARASRSTSSCAAAPGPTSAARRPRCSSRSRASAASRATSRRSPACRGLFGKPTAINNVETLYNVLEVLSVGGPVVRRGRRRALHRHEAVLPVRARSARPGVYEVDFGTTLRELLDLAGGVRGELRTILLGGAAGGFVMPDRLDVVAHPRGRARHRRHARVGRRARLRQPRRPHRHAAADRGVLPRRVVRAVRALPGRHGAPGGGAGPAGARRADRLAGDRDRAARRPRPCHARRLDLRPRPDRARGGHARRCSSGCSTGRARTGLGNGARNGKVPTDDHHGQGACRPRRRLERAGRRDDRRRRRGRRRCGDRDGPRGGAAARASAPTATPIRRRRSGPPSSTPPRPPARPRSASPAAR